MLFESYLFRFLLTINLNFALFFGHNEFGRLPTKHISTFDVSAPSPRRVDVTMSALQDILDKMYVDPELLEHLEEDQKLLLFIKMREEQIRRWKINEEKLAGEEMLKNSNRSRRFDNKRVQWKTGKDGEVWVWVMGEHSDDLTIEQIMENEAKEKARHLAEKELFMESLKRGDGGCRANEAMNLDEEKLKSQLMEIQIYPNQVVKSSRCSPYDELEKDDINATSSLYMGNSLGNIRQPRQSLPNMRSTDGELQLPFVVSSSRFLNNLSSQPMQTGAGFLLNEISTTAIDNSKFIQQQQYGSEQQIQSQFEKVPDVNGSDNNLRAPPVPQRPLNLRRSIGSSVSTSRYNDEGIENSERNGNVGGYLRTTPSPKEEFVQFTRSYVPGSLPLYSASSAPVSALQGGITEFSASLPFPVNTGILPYPIASTTVFASAPLSTQNSQIQPAKSRCENELNADVVAASISNGAGDSSTKSSSKPSSKIGFNIGGGRVSRLAARLSGGGKTAAFKVPQKLAVNERHNPRTTDQLTSNANFTTKTENCSAQFTQSNKSNDNGEVPLFRRAYSAPRITPPTVTKPIYNDLTDDGAKRLSTTTSVIGGYDHHKANTRNMNATTFKQAEQQDLAMNLKERSSLTEKENPMVRLRSVLREQPPSAFIKNDKQAEPEANVKLRLKDEVGVKTRIMCDNMDVNEIEKRQSKFLEQILVQQERIRREAEAEEQQKEWEAWEEQEKKAREAETQIRLIAQRAREEHMKMRTSSSLLPALVDSSFISLKDAIKSLPRPPKPKSRAAIVQWYREVERSNGTGFDPQNNRPACWFHGIISRTHAEELLIDKPQGSYLVRVSERIWGYTISYMSQDGLTKHFLVEKIPEGYQFLGTNQIVHPSLQDLVVYHETSPITPKGREILIRPIGQRFPESPDYKDLFET